MTRFQSDLLRAKARLQTRGFMQRHRARVWWGTELWVA